jgi:hypothetical protein
VTSLAIFCAEERIKINTDKVSISDRHSQIISAGTSNQVIDEHLIPGNLPVPQEKVMVQSRLVFHWCSRNTLPVSLQGHRGKRCSGLDQQGDELADTVKSIMPP